MAKTKVEKVYCWSGDHEIDPKQWMSQAGMCQTCYDSIVADVLTAHAEPVTEPRLPATVAIGSQPCSIRGCDARAVDACWICRDALCATHVQAKEILGNGYTVCPDCKGGQ